MPLNQYDYLLAIGTIFAALDAWNIGKLISCTLIDISFEIEKPLNPD